MHTQCSKIRKNVQFFREIRIVCLKVVLKKSTFFEKISTYRLRRDQQQWSEEFFLSVDFSL